LKKVSGLYNCLLPELNDVTSVRLFDAHNLLQTFRPTVKGLSLLGVVAVAVIDRQHTLELMTHDPFRNHVVNADLRQPGAEGSPQIMGGELFSYADFLPVS
jgi:hypothetical protein